MNKKIWVKEYLRQIFQVGLSENNSTKLRDQKIAYVNFPLYKYCSVLEDEKRDVSTIDYNINNLEQDILFFQDPKKFNDPYDCFSGFSQMQIIKDLVVKELTRNKQFTPLAKNIIEKLVNEVFKNGVDDCKIEEVDFESDLFIDIVEIIVEKEYSDFPIISEAMKEIFLTNEKGKKLLLKISQNSCTVFDEKNFIDLIYNNDKFRAMIKSQTTSSVFNTDLSWEMLKHDMKLKAERNRSNLFNIEHGQTFSIFETFKMALMSYKQEGLEEVDKIKKIFKEMSEKVMNESRKLVSRFFKVTCLSEKMDAPLMWSHYANKHYGFCVEYDFTYTLIKNYSDLFLAQLMLFPVEYSEERPLLSKALFDNKTKLELLKKKRLPNNFYIDFALGLLSKSSDWEYEKEWRILLLDEKRNSLKLPPPRKIFLGVNIEENAKKKIIEIAMEKKIPIYQMFLSPEKYKLDYYIIK